LLPETGWPWVVKTRLSRNPGASPLVSAPGGELAFSIHRLDSGDLGIDVHTLITRMVVVFFSTVDRLLSAHTGVMIGSL
jgi:hypothetical protein